MALKDNHPDLLEDVLDCVALADRAAESSLAGATTVENDHGRLERRVWETIADPDVIAWLDPDQHFARSPA